MKIQTIYPAFAFIFAVYSVQGFASKTYAKNPLAECVRQLVQQGVSPDEAASACGKDSTPTLTCAEVSIERFGYIRNKCKQINNSSQNRCAVASIEQFGYVRNSCLELDRGGFCAVASIEQFGYVRNKCKEINNSIQDRCAVASIEQFGYVRNDCLEL